MSSSIPPAREIAPDAAVDLHLHTLASDGFWTPTALIDELAKNEFAVAAVCDHDSQLLVPATIRLGAGRGITVIPGVEMTCWWNERQWHVLIYGIDPDRRDDESVAFRACLADVAEILFERATDARRRIEASGRKLTSLEDIRAARPLTPFHVLSSAIKEGYVKGLKESAELVVELGGNFTADLPIKRVVDAAHEAGGIAVMAHPGRADSVGLMTAADLDRMLAEEIALDGLEAHYRCYTDAQTAEYREMAKSRDLLISTGSDSHAPSQPVNPKPWRAIWSAELLARLGIRVKPLSESEVVWAPGMPLAPTPGGREVAPPETQTASAEESAAPNEEGAGENNVA